MTTKKTRRDQRGAPRPKPEKFNHPTMPKQAPLEGAPVPRVLTRPTLMHFTYNPEAAVVSANVQQDFPIAGQTQRVGQDVSIAISDLDADIRGAIIAVFTDLADHLGVQEG